MLLEFCRDTEGSGGCQDLEVLGGLCLLGRTLVRKHSRALGCRVGENVSNPPLTHFGPTETLFVPTSSGVKIAADADAHV